MTRVQGTTRWLSCTISVRYYLIRIPITCLFEAMCISYYVLIVCLSSTAINCMFVYVDSQIVVDWCLHRHNLVVNLTGMFYSQVFYIDIVGWLAFWEAYLVIIECIILFFLMYFLICIICITALLCWILLGKL